jgi:hypothetical protein
MPLERDVRPEPDESTAAGDFRVNNGRVIVCLASSAVMLIAGVAMIGAGYNIAFPEPVINKRVLTIAVGAVAVIFSVLLFGSNWKKYGQRVLVTSDGMRVRRRGGWTDLRWDDVTAVWRHSATIHGSLALLETDLWVQTNDGETIYLTSFLRDMARLVEIVLSETAQRMTPEMWSRIRSGDSVAFGKIAISATELTQKERRLAWDDVEEIRVAHGGIDVLRKEPRGSWFYSPVKKMPNYHIFLALAERLLNSRGPSAKSV